jgi:hypothetical protein
LKKGIVLSVFCLALLACASLVLMATSKNKFVFSPDGRSVNATEAPSNIIQAPQKDAKLKTIASNLSTYKNATYFSIWGNTIAQGGSNFPFQVWEAEPFTPTADATVTKIEVSAGRQGGGTAGFELGLYSDANGVPGTKIKSFHVAQLPSYGQCCTLAVANDKAGIPITGGTQYWVVVSTTSKDTDIYAWAFNSTDMRAHPAASWCQGSSTYCGSNSGKWVAYNYVQLGYAVLGQ